MTGSASNVALKLVMHHNKRENVVLIDKLVEASGTQLFFHWIGLKKLVQEHVKHNLVFALSPEIPGGIINFMVK